MAAVVESSCRVELLVSLQSSDGLVEVEVEDDEAGEGLESVSRREALDRLDRETFESRRRAAKALPLTTLERFADAFDDEREVVAACGFVLYRLGGSEDGRGAPAASAVAAAAAPADEDSPLVVLEVCARARCFAPAG